MDDQMLRGLVDGHAPGLERVQRHLCTRHVGRCPACPMHVPGQADDGSADGLCALGVVLHEFRRLGAGEGPR